MIWDTIALALMLISACLIAALIIRKIPQLASVEVESIPKEREAQLKKQLIVDRFIRQLRVALVNFKVIEEFWQWIVRRMEAWWERLRSLERQLWLRRTQDLPAVLHAARLVAESDPAEAERLLLEVLKQDPRNVEAYLGLAEVYEVRKEWTGAEESLRFLCKIDPKGEEGYLFRLVQVAQSAGNLERALRYAEDLFHRNSTEPRFLDLFVEVAILSKDRERATQGLARLNEVNPENAKIGEFERQIQLLG